MSNYKTKIYEVRSINQTQYIYFLSKQDAKDWVEKKQKDPDDYGVSYKITEREVY